MASQLDPSFWFYEKTDVCLPLPIAAPAEKRADVDIGHYYSFAIFIALNFILFIFIGGGQIVIFYAIRYIE